MSDMGTDMLPDISITEYHMRRNWQLLSGHGNEVGNCLCSTFAFWKLYKVLTFNSKFGTKI